MKETLNDFLMIASSRLKDLTPASDLGIFQADYEIGSIVSLLSKSSDNSLCINKSIFRRSKLSMTPIEQLQLLQQATKYTRAL
jgi:hypothetical protein